MDEEPDDFVGMETEITSGVNKLIDVVATSHKIVFCMDTVKISFKAVQVPLVVGETTSEERDESNWPVLEEEQEAEFAVDQENFHIPGVDCALLQMREGEQAQITCSPGWSYGDHGTTIPKGVTVADGKSIKVIVTLIKHTPCQKIPSEAEGDEEKAALAQTYKAAGNEWFKKGDLDRAMRRYDRGLDYIEDDVANNDECKESLGACIPLWGNLAAVYLKKGEFDQVVDLSGLILETDPENVKALLRLGTALTKMDDFKVPTE